MTTKRLSFEQVAYVIPWITLILVLGVTAYINGIIELGSLVLNPSGLIPPGTAVEPGRDLASVSRHLLVRIPWGITAIGYALVTIAGFVTAIVTLISCLREIRRRDVLRAATVLAAVILVLLIAVGQFGDWVLTEPDVTRTLRVVTMHRTAATHAVSVDAVFDQLSYLTFFLLTSAASAALVFPAGVEHSTAFLSKRLYYVQWLLYVGATSLVLRSLEMYCLYRWPGAWFSPPIATTIDKIALSVSAAHGAFYTAILTSMYLPAALVLRSRASQLAHRALPHGAADERDAWLTKAGLGSSPLKELMRVFAALSPLIAGGSLAKAIEVLTG